MTPSLTDGAKHMIFQAYINGIAERKVLSRHHHGKTPNLTFNGLSAIEQKTLINDLIESDEEVRELIASKISNALEDAYCDLIRTSEAEDDALDMRNFRAEDKASRASDMNHAGRGY